MTGVLRTENPTLHPDLFKAVLRGANLILAIARLNGADLRGADLREANLSGRTSTMRSSSGGPPRGGSRGCHSGGCPARVLQHSSHWHRHPARQVRGPSPLRYAVEQNAAHDPLSDSILFELHTRLRASRWASAWTPLPSSVRTLLLSWG